MRGIVVFIMAFQLLSCQGKNQEKENCSKENAYNKITQIPEVSKAVNTYKTDKHQIIFTVDEGDYKNKKYYIIKEEQEGEFSNSVWNIFYVDKSDCSVSYYDTVSGDLMSLSQWRSLGKKNEKKSMEKISFTDLFNEGTIIKFTPNDLINKSNNDIQEFKKKLQLFEEQNPVIADFDVKNLSALINNETFFDLQYYTDSSWLEYFIQKYKIDASKLEDPMALAIRQEDFNAVKILVKHGYIISKKDLVNAADTENEAQEKLKENKTDGYESYIAGNSRINLISSFLRQRYDTNKIQDPDGYTNLRKDKSTASEVIQKVKSGDFIEVLDNSGDWFLVKTKDGKEGYIYRNRIKSA